MARRQGHQPCVRPARIDDELAVNGKRRGAEAPRKLLMGIELGRQVLSPEYFAGFQLDAMQVAERAVQDDEAVEDQRRGARGIAVVKIALGSVVYGPTLGAGACVQAAKNVHRVGEIPAGHDD